MSVFPQFAMTAAGCSRQRVLPIGRRTERNMRSARPVLIAAGRYSGAAGICLAPYAGIPLTRFLWGIGIDGGKGVMI